MGANLEAADFGPPRGETEMQRLAEIQSEAFGLPVDQTRPWLDGSGPANVRVLRVGGGVIAGLKLIPMGQHFGGRSVPMVGIAGVATDLTARGAGAGTRLMRATVAELRRTGWPLSALYPATQPVYRRAGYEQAGSRFLFRAQARDLRLGDRGLAMRGYGAMDREAVETAYRAFASRRAGWLDRGRYIWDRVLRPRGELARGHLVVQDGNVVGWVFVTAKKSDDGRQNLRLSDLGALGPRAASRLLSFLGDHASVTDSVEWFGGSDDPSLLLPAEQRIEASLYSTWMVRVVDPAAALAARGWPRGLSTELHLAVDDEVLPSAAGRYKVTIDDRVARVEPGGEGRIRLHVRGLAALYTGHLSPHALAGAGLLEGPDADLEAAAAAFAGPPPSMPDMF